MKLRLLFLLSVIALLSPTLRAEFTFKYEYEGNTLVYEVIDEEGKTCKVCKPYEYGIKNTYVIVPEVVNNGVNNYSVIEIGKEAFAYNRSITSIVIPNSVIYIGSGAFSNCYDLVSVEIPSSVTQIGDGSFMHCSGLKEIDIPNSVTKIGNLAFCECDSLTKIRIPNSITAIEYETFMDCTSLTSVSIPASVTAIMDDAFKGCIGMTKAEFASIESLCNIKFGNAYSNPLSQAHHLYIGGNEITDLVIPNTVTYIDQWTFLECTAITSIEISNSVKQIILAYCTGLTSIDLPNSVKGVGLVGCYGLTSINIPNSVTGVVLRDCTGLTSIDIPNSVTGLTLIGCTGLTSIDLPNSLTSIQSSDFSDCTGLTSVRIPNSVTKIGYGAFAGCKKLDTVTLGNGLNSISDNAFKDCPVSNIYITAPNPPKAPVNAFSDYSGTLHLQGEASAVAYGNDETWGKFKRELMIEPTGLTIDGANYVSGEPGETFQLKADIYPADVTLPYIYWKSTNPRIATVDNNGLVTLFGDEEEDKTRAEENDSNDNSCKIIAESLYYDGPIAEVTVFNSDFNGVDTVMEELDNESIDYSQPYEIYNMNGVKIADSVDRIAKGIYVVRQGNLARKITAQ